MTIELGDVSGIGAQLVQVGADVSSLGFTEGAIAGGLLIGASLLAGIAASQRESKAFCALLLVTSAAALQLTSVGVIAKPTPSLFTLIQAIFASAILVFLTAAVRVVSEHRLFGGAVFAVALSVIAISVINIVVRGDISGLMRTLLIGIGGFAVVLSLIEAFRGDTGARLILPGVLLAAGGVGVGSIVGGIGSALPGALFAMGILGASFIAFVETAPRPMTVSPPSSKDPTGAKTTQDHLQKLRVSENELAQVLDYSGLAIWDWSPAHSHQTDHFSTVMGASSDAKFAPKDFKAFVKTADFLKFEREVFGQVEGDGGFDFLVELYDGRTVHMRGARAVDGNGAPERVVLFIEDGTDTSKPQAPEDARPVDEAADPERQAFGTISASALTTAIEENAVAAAFQPIVSLNDRKAVGFEGLLRLPNFDGADVDRERHMAEVIRTAQHLDRTAEIGVLMVKLALEKHAQMGGGENFFSVNFSRAALLDEKLVDALGDTLDAARASGLKLVIEITESDRGIDLDRIAAVASRLTDLGVTFALDDFGSGFARLADLTAIKFDFLKIDKSLIGKLDKSDDARKVVRSLTGLAKDLDIKTIAEGVESDEIAKASIEAGCDLGQGFLFGEPKILTSVPVPTSPAILDQGLNAELPTGRRQSRRLFGSDLR